ncbi:hypothetical protein BXZ70DRAFT_710087 [Cristinia sonorae]|uniref:Uncharacterized protein n=1 Tax=Cristinia sonorae TaxID=1940300 RepID=A0A8K0UE62_9AGAR|nr:hypothetical protein BXZ70DRAFT_710087 [Cristinia sonorae]
MAVKQEVKPEPVDVQLSKGRQKPAKPVEVSEKDKQAALKSISDFRKASAWELHRWPLTKFVVDDRTKIHLPKGYVARNGEDVKTMWAGTDVNQFVHNHYMGLVSTEKLLPSEANYVSEGNILARRHEFMGPDPRVAGYSYDNFGELHINWWDKFLQEQWMDEEKWRFEVMQDDDGRWVAKNLHH